MRRGAGRESGGGGGGPQHTSCFINTKPCGNKNTAVATFTHATNGAAAVHGSDNRSRPVLAFDTLLPSRQGLGPRIRCRTPEPSATQK